MDYEKKYKEALERVRELLSRCIDNRDRRTKVYRVEDIESIFPELKEDKDKRIKFLIKSSVYASDTTPEGREEIFTWLEEQHSPVLSNSSNIGKNEKCSADKVIEWLIRYMPLFWDTPCTPQRIVEQFKEDFGL